MNKSDQMDVFRNLDGSIESHYEDKRGYTLEQIKSMFRHNTPMGVEEHKMVIDFDFDGTPYFMYRDVETPEERDERLRELSKLQTGMKIWVAK